MTSSDSHERYGAGKIKAALERRGVTAFGRRIVSIMKRRGMTSAYARRTSEPHKTRADGAGLANILDREFDGHEPRTHLASDLTYVRVGGKWAYVCLLIGLANRGVAGHGADTGRTAGLVMAAFATLDFPLTEVEVFRTDRGGGFDNARIDELLDVFDIGRSPSGKGDPYDNELRPDCWTLFIRIQAQTTVDALRNSSGVRPPSRIWRRLVFQWMM